MKSFGYAALAAVLIYSRHFPTQSLSLVPPSNFHSKILYNSNQKTSKLRSDTTPRRTKSVHNTCIFCHQSNDNNLHEFQKQEEKQSKLSNRQGGGGGTYRRFVDYAWEKILQSGLLSDSDDMLPEELATNSSPARGFPEGSIVNIELRCATRPSSEGERTTTKSPLRLARYALLETLAPTDATTTATTTCESFQSIPQGIHVLNLVLFPDVSLALPVLGVDLVTLPGGKHLMAIDFQPILPPQENVVTVFPQPYEHYKTRLETLHQKYVLDQRDVMPWGGDIPPPAQRFFSPYALWTRIQEKQKMEEEDMRTTTRRRRRDCQSIIQKEVFDAFCAYFDLYLEMMLEVNHNDDENDTINTTPNREENHVVQQGHVDYLNYRRDNDPARPMLTRLYGEDYAESVIRDILFQMI